MDDKQGLMDLSTEEAAFFDSKGETAPPEPTAATVEEPAAPMVPAKEEPITEAGDDDLGDEPIHKTGDLSKAVVAKNREIQAQKARTREAETKLATLQGKLETLERLVRGEPRQPSQQPPVPVIDVDNDPMGALKLIDKKLAEIDQRDAARSQETQQQQQERVFHQNYVAAAQEFTKKTPDFPDAYSHLVSSRVSELQMIGQDPAMIDQMVKAEEMMIINTALSKGEDPITKIYELAKLRGYAKAAPEAPKLDGVTKVAAMNKAEKATKSLSSAPGTATNTPTLDALANMSEDEFAEATAGKNWRKLFGA
jgi:hypothetical protein